MPLRHRHPIRPSACAGPNRRLPRGRPIPEAFPMDSSMLKFIFGRLTLDALPLHEPILVTTFAVVALGGVALFGALTYFRLWGYRWKERSEEHTSALQSPMPISSAVLCLKNKQ